MTQIFHLSHHSVKRELVGKGLFLIRHLITLTINFQIWILLINIVFDFFYVQDLYLEAVWLLLSMENDLPFKCYLIISHCFYDDNTIMTCSQEFFIITKATPLWHIELYFLSCKDDISFTWINWTAYFPKYWNVWNIISQLNSFWN